MGFATRVSSAASTGKSPEAGVTRSVGGDEVDAVGRKRRRPEVSLDHDQPVGVSVPCGPGPSRRGLRRSSPHTRVLRPRPAVLPSCSRRRLRPQDRPVPRPAVSECRSHRLRNVPVHAHCLLYRYVDIHHPLVVPFFNGLQPTVSVVQLLGHRTVIVARFLDECALARLVHPRRATGGIEHHLHELRVAGADDGIETSGGGEVEPLAMSSGVSTGSYQFAYGRSASASSSVGGHDPFANA